MADRLAFSIPSDLRRRVDAAIEAVRSDPGDSTAVAELIAVVNELTETGLHYYFLHPLELAEVGVLSRSTAQVGLAAAKQGIPRLIRRVVNSMSEEQILAIVDFLDRNLIREGTDPSPRGAARLSKR